MRKILFAVPLCCLVMSTIVLAEERPGRRNGQENGQKVGQLDVVVNDVPAASTPEITLSGAAAAFALLSGGGLILTERFRSRK